MSNCKNFQQEAESALGEILRSRGYVLTNSDEIDGCRLYYASARRELCIYDSRRNAEVNCLVRLSRGGRWITVAEAIGHGKGLTDSELIDMMPDKPLSNDEMLREVGSMLRQLDS